MKARAYQEKAIKEVLAGLVKHKTVLLHAYMGAGKTYIAMAVAKQIGLPTLVLAHRRSLVQQLVDAGFSEDIVTTRQAMARRLSTSKGRALIIIDEAHGAANDSYRKIIAAYPDAMVLGLTATPERLDKRPLFAGQKGTHEPVFAARVMVPDVKRLAKIGHILIPQHYTSAMPPKLSDLPKQGGDYKVRELEERVVPLVGELSAHYRKFRAKQRRQAMVYAVSIAHAEAVVRKFTEEGIGAVVVHSKDSKSGQNIDLFRDGKVEVLVNVAMLTEGFDHPSLGMVILARPTLSRALYLQMAGRVMRPWEGKKPVILDHAGCYHQHGGVEDDYDYATGEQRTEPRKRCHECGLLNDMKVKLCSECGADLANDPATKTLRQLVIEETDDELRRKEEVERQKEAEIRVIKENQKKLKEYIALRSQVIGPTEIARKYGLNQAQVAGILKKLKANPSYVPYKSKHNTSGMDNTKYLSNKCIAKLVDDCMAFIRFPSADAFARTIGVSASLVRGACAGKFKNPLGGGYRNTA